MIGKLCFQLKATDDIFMLVSIFKNVSDKLLLFVNNYLLHTYYVLGTCISALYTVVSKTRLASCF